MKKLKRIIKRIKYWLIRKLGGYTEQNFVTMPSPIIYTHPINTLEGTYSVPMERLSDMSAHEIEEWSCRHIADELSKKLLESDAVKVETEKDPLWRVINFRWRVQYIGKDGWEYE
ncbi:MAG: hypothetical protein KBS43_04610 [Oscillospiraceae bacterium]|nr:hypothetical protein [Candidatus Limimonas coprohippi]